VSGQQCPRLFDLSFALVVEPFETTDASQTTSVTGIALGANQRRRVETTCRREARA
jgi:hypothetical protein